MGDRNSFARMREEHVSNVRAVSATRLKMKKYQALLQLIEGVEPELRARFETTCQALEEEEAAALEGEIEAVGLHGADGECLPGLRIQALGESEVGQALLKSFTPMIDRHARQQEPSPSLGNTPTRKMPSSAPSLPGIVARGSPPRPNIISTYVSIPTDVSRRNTRPPRPRRKIGLQSFERASDPESSGDPDEEIPHRPVKRTCTYTDPALVRSLSPVRPASEPGLWPPSSSTMAAEAPSEAPSGSIRSGLRRAAKPAGSYNEAATFRGLGLLR
ncbi:hypothetical protein JX266_002917 [Neoarthrinium moseri]|uniref:uncharacterized protein n=1 Tax=Neoarthrinium moseri TaxID=1658444 RepID=UPI001FDBB801|nr:uncharacterized protein JN550_004828 [Neoarthrinium moseri]KAI1852064.1 hypothetical protein JX266_002917 [Neoarthrinium moseri]KAI1870682.1 hypothetical protein JN550_004828 [Neoarthrinium moseri]